MPITTSPSKYQLNHQRIVITFTDVPGEILVTAEPHNHLTAGDPANPNGFTPPQEKTARMGLSQLES